VRLSVTTKVTALVAVAVISMSSVSTYLYISAQKRGIEREVTARGIALSEALSRSVSEGLAEENLNLIRQVEDIVHTKDVILTQVFSSLWLDVASVPFDQLNVPPDPAAVEYFKARKGGHSPFSKSVGSSIDIYKPVFLESHDTGIPDLLIGYVRLKISTREIKETIEKAVVMNMFVAALLTVLAIVVLNSIIGKYVLGPVLNLHKSISKHKGGEFPEMVPVGTRDEIGELSSEFNEMSRVLREREERLSEEKERLAVTLGSIGDGVIVTDGEGIITLMNTMAERFTGWSSQEAIGRRLSEVLSIVDKSSRERCDDPVNKIKERGLITGPSKNSVLIRKDGSEIIIEESGAPIRDRDGEIAGTVLVLRDVTERKMAEDALYASEKKFRDLLETIHLAAVILDCDGIIIFCNDYLFRLTGWSTDEVLTKNWFDLFFPEDVRESEKTVFRANIEQGAMLHHENQILTRDGAFLHMVWDVAVLYGSAGRATGIAGIGIDVTEQRKLEEQLRQAQKMEAIGHLAGGVAHDFNNILTAIIGYGSLLLNKIPADNPSRAYVDHILAASERAANLTQSLLAFSRKQILNPKPVNVNDIVLGMKKILERVIGEDIEIKVGTADYNLIVKADKSQIEQVLMNLATNARDAMPLGGILTLTTEEVEIDNRFIQMHQYGEAGRYAVISVADNGVGMDEKTRGSIFEPFFTTKEVGKGTGLGLAMVYGTVKQHNGFINVYSEPGEGTRFNIYLPLAESDPQIAGKKASTPLSLGDETILLVEDDEAVRRVTKTMLEESGYTVLEAVDGEEAVRLFGERKDAVQLVISDIIMPRQSGKDLQKELKKIDSGVKVLFISGYAADILTQKGIADEGVYFLSKPLVPHILSRKVRAVLDA